MECSPNIAVAYVFLFSSFSLRLTQLITVCLPAPSNLLSSLSPCKLENTIASPLTHCPPTLNPQPLEAVSSGDSLDWKDLSAGEIVSRVTSKVQAGSIVLFHNAALHTPEALPTIIETLLQEGYSFCPVSEIILDSEYTIDHTGRQCPAA